MNVFMDNFKFIANVALVLMSVGILLWVFIDVERKKLIKRRAIQKEEQRKQKVQDFYDFIYRNLDFLDAEAYIDKSPDTSWLTGGEKELAKSKVRIQINMPSVDKNILTSEDLQNAEKIHNEIASKFIKSILPKLETAEKVSGKGSPFFISLNLSEFKEIENVFQEIQQKGIDQSLSIKLTHILDSPSSNKTLTISRIT